MPESDAQAAAPGGAEKLAAFWADGEARSVTLAHEPAGCACELAFPSIVSRLGLSWRYLVVKLAELTPISALKVRLLRLAGVRLGSNVCIGPEVKIDPFFPRLIAIEDGCILGQGCRIFTHEYTATAMRIGRVRIGRGAVVGAYSSVRSGVTVGEGSTIGFHSYVNRDVPDGLTVGGVPARILRPGAGGRG